MLGETCVDIDFNLSDILCSVDDYSSDSSVKKSNSNGNFNPYSFSFTVESVPSYELSTDIEDDIFKDDLCALLETCHSHTTQPSDTISLSALASNHLSRNLTNYVGTKSEKESSSPLTSSLKDVYGGIKSYDCLKDILLEENFEDHDSSSIGNLLCTVNWEHSSEKNKQNPESEVNSETVDDELIPDIDLSFCIKKNDKDKFSPVSSSPETSDSGFDESDFSTKSISSSSNKNLLCENFIENDRVPLSSLTSKKLSLFSKAISAKSKIDQSRKEKLRNIRKGLLLKNIPQASLEIKQDQNFEGIIDYSDNCVISSCFSTISEQL